MKINLTIMKKCVDKESKTCDYGGGFGDAHPKGMQIAGQTKLLAEMLGAFLLPVNTVAPTARPTTE